jgi:hypothetical protein
MGNGGALLAQDARQAGAWRSRGERRLSRPRLFFFHVNDAIPDGVIAPEPVDEEP